MKPFLTILFLTGLFLYSFSQTSFNPVLISGPLEEIPMCLKQIGDNYYGSVKISNSENGIWNGSRLMKWNANGNLQAEIEFDFVDSSYYRILEILALNNSEFLTIGAFKKSKDDNGRLWVMCVDTSLGVQWEKSYKYDTPLHGFIRATFKNDSTIAIATSCDTYWPEWQQKLLFLKINTDGDSLLARYETTGNPNYTKVYSIEYLNGQYKAFVNGFSSYVPYVGFSQILQLDDDFNLLGVKPTPFDIEGYMTAKKINESSYFIAGMAYSSLSYYDVAIAKLNITEDSLAYNHVGEPGVAVDYCGWQKCMSVSTPNSIYIGGTGNDNGLFYSCYNNNKEIILSNLDSLLNIRWTRFYECDTACLTLSTIESTSDGGCILGCMLYSAAHQENMLDALIIKVDSAGLITSLHEQGIVQVHEVMIYPNPGSDEIIVSCGPQLSGAIITFFDATGNRVMSKTLTEITEKIKIDVTSIAPGAYVWRISLHGKVIDTGKWIKQ
jgi:hypothetical protein